MNSTELENKINKLLEKKLSEKNAIVGIIIGSHGGDSIASKFKKTLDMTELQVTAANSSILFLSSKLLKKSLNQQIAYDLIAGKERIIISILTKSITLIAYLNRELAELEGVQDHISDLKDFALQITAIVETSNVIREDLFVKLKLAIPNALTIAIITKEGMPIKVESTMPEPTLSAMTAALYELSNILLEKKGLEYSIIGGDNGSIIVHELDKTRVLAVAIPELDNRRIKSYIAKIKTILKPED
jgi:predicted regulator of Ras-like GTPase activity (Roadblock/LC7/MglB family)